LECRLVRCCNYDESLAALQLLLCPRLSWHHHGRNRIATKHPCIKILYGLICILRYSDTTSGKDWPWGTLDSFPGLLIEPRGGEAQRRRLLHDSCEEEQCRKGYKGGEPSNCHNCALSFSDY
jgi:hypothetical protein